MEAFMSTELNATTDSRQIPPGNQCDKFKHGSPPMACRCIDCTDKFKETVVMLAPRDDNIGPGETVLGGEGASAAVTAPVATAADLGFVLDSGASCHATGKRKLLTDVTWQTGRGVVLASGNHLLVVGSGAVISEKFTLGNVRLVRGLTKNIVSVSMLTQLDYCIDFTKTGCFVREGTTGEIAGKGRLVAGLFQLDFLHVPLERAAAAPPGPATARDGEDA